MDDRAFQLFGLSHWTALTATVLTAVGMVRLHRSRHISEKVKQRLNVALACLLLLAVAVDPVLTWLRYRSQPELAAQLIRENSLPLYLCDVVAIVLAVALITRRQRWAEIGYLWGLAGTAQGLLTPTLYFDWSEPEYYAFFAEHGGVPVAAITLVWGMGLRPQPGAFRRIVGWSWVFMAGVGLLNFPLDTNYAFLRHKPAVASLFDLMGPEPWYLLTLQAIAFSLYALLLLPFRRDSRRPGVPAGATVTEG
ncbi:MAG: TIGR02206 family membrane protein [Verrucomicrobiota bacterium]